METDREVHTLKMKLQEIMKGKFPICESLGFFLLDHSVNDFVLYFLLVLFVAVL